MSWLPRKKRDEVCERKPVTEFKPGDTIYIKKMNGGFDFHYQCEFVKFEKGLVHAVPKFVMGDRQVWDDWSETGKVMTARLTNCYVWQEEPRPQCCWFKTKDESP